MYQKILSRQAAVNKKKMSDHLRKYDIVTVENDIHQRMLRNVAANAAEYRSIFNHIHFAKKRNFEEDYYRLMQWLKLCRRD